MENGSKIIWSLLIFTFFSFTLIAQKKNPTQLIQEMETALGGWDKLYAQHDVEFQYDYHYPGEDIRDVSTERYIFEGEHSWAKYETHQINVLKDQQGTVVQCYNGSDAAISLNGKKIDNPQAIGGSQFLRKANYFWFVMMFKLDDPGTSHKYLGKEKMNGINYDKVAVSYNSEVTGKPQNDAYILYINPKTKLVDRFFFSLPAMGVNDPILAMQVEYTDVNGVKLPLKRYAFRPGQDGQLEEKPFLVQTSTNLKFNNGFKEADLSLN